MLDVSCYKTQLMMDTQNPLILNTELGELEAVGTVGLEISVITGIMRGSHCGGQAVIAER